MPLKIPLGISDFKTIIDEGYYYVDKTLFIEELKRSNGQVLLIPRPRRFGKTLNLSMLQYFYEISHESNAHLFKNTAIWKKADIRKLQGTYPVIFLTFKDCKDRDKSTMFSDIKEVIIQEFRRHYNELKDSLNNDEHKDYIAIKERKAPITLYKNSLRFLTHLLKQKYKKKAIVLIDEYDAPIHAAYNNGFYQDVIDFMRALLSGAFKDNKHLARGVLTGILRTGKEGIFSGLNNLKIRTLLDNKFSDKFGFTIKEVDQLLRDVKLTKKAPLIKEWYNSYRCGKTVLYNPWSLLECIDNDGEIDAYWANTSDNELIKNIIAQADNSVKSELEALLSGATIEKEIATDLTLPGIESDDQAIWSLLLFAGYLTFTHIKIIEGKKWCKLTIPNQEIHILYRSLITNIMGTSLSKTTLRYLRQSIEEADSEVFSTVLQEFISKSMSYYDMPSTEPERGYHLFVLGLLVLLSDTYTVKSNKESGFGRYDILLIPHDKKKFGLILEFKKVSSQETFEKASQKALDQINEKNYAQELKDLGIKKIAAFGIACKGKEIVVKAQRL